MFRGLEADQQRRIVEEVRSVLEGVAELSLDHRRQEDKLDRIVELLTQPAPSAGPSPRGLPQTHFEEEGVFDDPTFSGKQGGRLKDSPELHRALQRSTAAAITHALTGLGLREPGRPLRRLTPNRPLASTRITWKRPSRSRSSRSAKTTRMR